MISLNHELSLFMQCNVQIAAEMHSGGERSGVSSFYKNGDCGITQISFKAIAEAVANIPSKVVAYSNHDCFKRMHNKTNQIFVRSVCLLGFFFGFKTFNLTILF